MAGATNLWTDLHRIFSECWYLCVQLSRPGTSGSMLNNLEAVINKLIFDITDLIRVRCPSLKFVWNFDFNYAVCINSRKFVTSKKTFLMLYKLFPGIAWIKVCLLEIEVNLCHKPSLYFKKTFLITYKLFPAIALIKVCLLEIKVNLFFFSTKCISF